MTTSHGKDPEYAGVNVELFAWQLSFYFIANDITNAGKRKAIFVSSVLTEVFHLLSGLISPAKVSDDAITNKSIVKMLYDHIKPGKSPQLSRYEFDNWFGFTMKALPFW